MAYLHQTGGKYSGLSGLQHWRGMANQLDRLDLQSQLSLRVGQKRKTVCVSVHVRKRRKLTDSRELTTLL